MTQAFTTGAFEGFCHAQNVMVRFRVIVGHRFKERLLGGKVKIDCTLTDAQTPGYIIKPGSGITLNSELLKSGLHNLLGALCFLLCPRQLIWHVENSLRWPLLCLYFILSGSCHSSVSAQTLSACPGNETIQKIVVSSEKQLILK